MKPLPTIRQIRFLIALKQENSFHKAAEYCGVTQSTLSAGIQEMEAILTAPVIDRANRKKLVFTALGLKILEQGKEIIRHLEEISEEASRKDAPLSSSLRLGIIPTIAPYLLPKILRPLHKSFPRLHLHLHEKQSAELVQSVEKGELDAAIIAFPFDTGNLKQLSLFKEKFYCAAPKTIFSDQGKVSLSDIQSHKMLLLADGHCLREHALTACRMKASPQTQDVSATSLATLIQLVSQNYGITLLPEMVVRDGHLPKTMHILPITTAPVREIGIIWRNNAIIQQDVMALAKAISHIIHD